MTFQDWLQSICITEKPHKSIIAYNVGIFESVDGYMVYLIGSKEFDEEDSDWATNEDFIPKNKYYRLPKQEFKDMKWDEVQTKIEQMLKDFINSDTFKRSFFSEAKAITTGFDDGDLIRVK